MFTLHIACSFGRHILNLDKGPSLYTFLFLESLKSSIQTKSNRSTKIKNILHVVKKGYFCKFIETKSNKSTLNKNFYELSEKDIFTFFLFLIFAKA